MKNLVDETPPKAWKTNLQKSPFSPIIKFPQIENFYSYISLCSSSFLPRSFLSLIYFFSRTFTNTCIFFKPLRIFLSAKFFKQKFFVVKLSSKYKNLVDLILTSKGLNRHKSSKASKRLGMKNLASETSMKT
jgi:hypothetical protein